MVIHPPRRRGQAQTRTGRTPFATLPNRAPARRPRPATARVIFGVRCGRHDRGQRGLAGRTRQRCRRAVHRACPGLPCRQIRGELTAGRVMGVHMHRQIEPRTQRRYQRRRGLRPQQPGHVLDRQHMRARIDDLLGQLQVIVQRVKVLAGVGQVTGVAHRDFGYRRACFAHGVDRRTHRLDVVQRVEDPVDVDPGRRRLVDERLRDRLWIRGVADGVAPTQQHLQADVGHRLPKRGQPIPRIFLQEPKRHIVSRSAPAFDRQQLRHHPRNVGRHHQQTRWCASRVASND